MVRGTNKLLKKSPDRSGRKRNQTAFIYLNTRQARISIEYTQRNTMANVTGTIENEDCGASSGGYTVAVGIDNLTSGRSPSFRYQHQTTATAQLPNALSLRIR